MVSSFLDMGGTGVAARPDAIVICLRGGQAPGSRNSCASAPERALPASAARLPQHHSFAGGAGHAFAGELVLPQISRAITIGASFGNGTRRTAGGQRHTVARTRSSATRSSFFRSAYD